MSRAYGPVAVLSGGISSEREVSLRSGAAVLEALLGKGIEAFAIDPSGDPSAEIKRRGARMAFIALHGAFGEDGSLQRMLEAAGIAYTGCGPEAGALAFDKAAAQEKLRLSGVSVPRSQVLRRGQAAALPPREAVVVKPATAGSSIGISIVPAGLPLGDAVGQAFLHSDTVLIEEFIRGKELTVSILGDQALPIVEIIPSRPFYDYQAKYEDQGTRYLCPAQLDPAAAEVVERAALSAYRALGCRVMGRVDLMLSEQGRPYVLEINTIPGLTDRSLLPKAARAAGIDFPDLCVKILELSAWRQKPMSVTYGQTS